jgi:hypothetical protein
LDHAGFSAIDQGLKDFVLTRAATISAAHSAKGIVYGRPRLEYSLGNHFAGGIHE